MCKMFIIHSLNGVTLQKCSALCGSFDPVLKSWHYKIEIEVLHYRNENGLCAFVFMLCSAVTFPLT